MNLAVVKSIIIFKPCIMSVKLPQRLVFMGRISSIWKEQLMWRDSQLWSTKV